MCRKYTLRRVAEVHLPFFFADSVGVRRNGKHVERADLSPHGCEKEIPASSAAPHGFSMTQGKLVTKDIDLRISWQFLSKVSLAWKLDGRRSPLSWERIITKHFIGWVSPYRWHPSLYARQRVRFQNGRNLHFLR
jgi:hypothetical protein